MASYNEPSNQMHQKNLITTEEVMIKLIYSGTSENGLPLLQKPMVAESVSF